jgi:hypothetical protein
VTAFAVQIDLADGSTQHSFGSGAAALQEAYAFRDGWRGRHPDSHCTLIGDAGERRVYVRDITDVRVLAGNRR